MRVSLRPPHGPRRLVLAAAVVAAVALPMTAQVAEKVDLEAVYKIKDEGLGRSQVMEIMSWLTDVHGPRLTNSPIHRAAGNWAVKKMTEWGLANAKLEPWGPFGRGWTNERVSVHVTAPTAYPVIAYPKAWTPGTSGVVTAEVVMPTINIEKDLAEWKGKLKGKIVMTAPMREVPALWTPLAKRYTDEDLEMIATQPEPQAAPGLLPGMPAAGGRGVFAGRGGTPPAPGTVSPQQRMQFFVDEGVAATLDPGRGDGGTVFVGGGGGRQPGDPPTVPQLVLAIEAYGRIARTLVKKIPVTLEINVQNTFHDADLNNFNVVADLPGTDKADELVMLGAHFDSWHGGTGATDNAAGSAVMMEALRILKTTGLKLRRTVRIGLWGGEEQGLLGSRAYVTQHFADRQTMALKPEHAKFAGYFNVDNGTGAIRGVYLQGNEGVGPIFSAWMQPFHAMGMKTITARNTGGTDHQSYDAVGLPGFQFVQDSVEYDTRTHHSSQDVYERIQPRDMMYNAVIVASFVYHTANRDQILPRKPLPKPPPAGGGRRGSGPGGQ